jgi:hypothetical protein
MSLLFLAGALLLTGALLLDLVHHPFRLFLLHVIFSFELPLLLHRRMEVEARLELIHLLESAIAVIKMGVFLILHISVLILGEDVAGLLGGRIGPNHDLVLIQGLKDDLAVGERLNDGAELWQVEFFILDDQALCGEVDKDLAKSHLAVLLEL